MVSSSDAREDENHVHVRIQPREGPHEIVIARPIVGSSLYRITSVPESAGFHVDDVVACHEESGEVVATAVVTPSAHRRLVIEFKPHIAVRAIEGALATLEKHLRGKGRLVRERRYVFDIAPRVGPGRRAELRRYLEEGLSYGGFTYEQDAW
jgi:hypothetical protein